MVDIYQPGMVSEHLAWSTHDDVFYNDLLPVPYTDETLAKVVEHVDQVQETLKRRILIENPSTYVTFETIKLARIRLHGRDWQSAPAAACCSMSTMSSSLPPITIIRRENISTAYPLHLVSEIHLAGHADRPRMMMANPS